MKTTRKQFTTLALAALAAISFIGHAAAQGAYPSKNVTLVVPTAAGGTTDLSARMLAQALGPVLGQTVVVDNKGGGNGNIAASIVKRAEADGYTLLMQYSGYHVISPHITKQKQWEQGDFQPVANVISAPQIIVVRADLPVKTLPELIAYAKANPGKLNYASAGQGSTNHLSAALFEKAAGVKMMHIPYRGAAPAVLDTVAGRTQVLFSAGTQTLPHVQSGKLKLLAVTESQRSRLLPQVPTVAETVPGYELAVWYGAFGPAGMPQDVVQRLSREINAILARPEVIKKMGDMGVEVRQSTPQGFAQTLQNDADKYGKLVRELGISME